MRQSSRDRRPEVPPDGNGRPVSRALSNSSHVGNDQPVGDRSLAELQRNAHESELLRQIAVKANEAATADEAIQACLNEVCAYTGWPVGHAYMSATDDTGEPETTKLWHIDDPERYENFRRATEATDYMYDQGLPSRVVSEAAPQWMVADMTHQHSPRADARIEAGLKSGFAFPAMAGKSVVAVLEFFSPEAIEPDPQFLSVTAEIGILIGQAIERKRAEQALADSEIRYRQLAELSPDGMLVHVDGEIVFANASLARILAVPSPEDLLGIQAIELIAPEFRASMEQRRKKVLKGEISASAQVEFVRSDGSRVPVERTGARISWEGKPAIVILFRDISEREAIEDELRLTQYTLDQAGDAVFWIGVNGGFQYANESSERMLGYSGDELSALHIWDVDPDVAQADWPRIWTHIANRGQYTFESVHLTKDGDEVPVEVMTTPVSFGDRKIVCSFSREITERKRAEKALVESRDQLRLVTDNLPAWITYIDAEQHYRFVNKTASEWLARPAEEIVGKSVAELLGQEYEKVRSRIDRTLGGKQLAYVESIAYPDGVTRTVRVTYVPHFGTIGSVEGYFTLIEDITELQQAEEALRESEERLRAITDHSPSAIFLKDTDGCFIFANQVWHDTYNPTGADIAGKTVHDILPPEIADPAAAVDAKLLQEGVPVVIEQVLPNAGGEWQDILSTKFPVRDGNGDIIAIGAVNTDITDRVAAEQALRESEERFRSVFENSPTALSLKDMEGRFRLVNAKFTEWFGAQPEEVIGKTTHEISPNEFSDASDALERKVIETGETHDIEHDIPFADGMVHSLTLTKFPVLGPDNKIVGVGTINTDITQHRQTELALRQAQKMEAVGQLTGGVAHDFNNLLAVVLGNTELLGDEIGDNDLLTSIDRAATRGAELTQRLLAFSRQQALQPQSIDLRELLPSLESLFQRTLGEPVKMLMNVPEDIWPVLADPGQLENALLNLAINARDAMPGGGFLEIWCSNIELQEGDLRVNDEVAAGDYVQITVRDTGTGMPEDVLEHVFEPFYTTKDVGKGSGLGLSMVYGFARQSSGDAVIESEPDKGTEVRIFLPRSEVTTMSDEPLQGKANKRGQGEAILVLEDDPDVRSFAVNALVGLGYRVLEAGDANAALQILKSEAENIDLLLSDVVLPGGVSGPELAAKAKDLFPELKLVFMSGYAADLYTSDKIPGFNEILLTKPFRLADLADAVHETLAA